MSGAILQGVLATTSFDYEYQRARLKWLEILVPVLPLERIYAIKKFVGRPKDLAHLPLLAQTIGCNAA